MNKKLQLLFSLSLLIKLILSLLLPLTLDEYYYFLWGEHLSLSYFDHPPAVGWIMYLSQPFASLAEGAIRWPFALMSQATVFLWFKIVSQEIRKDYLFWFVLTALANPLWGLGGVIATPDIPLMFFWTLSIFFCHRLIHAPSWSNYLALGLSLGLGFVSKYQIVLFIPALIWMIFQQNLSKRLISWKTLGTITLGLICSSPVLLWNAAHDWASFAFQWQHGMSAKVWSWKYPFDYLFSQIFLIFPVFLAFLLQKQKKWKAHWLFPLAAFPLLFFFYSSFQGRVEGNWAVMAFPSVYALAFIYMTPEIFRWVKRTNMLWLSLSFVIMILLPFKDSIPHKGIKLFEAERYTPVLSALDESKVYLAYNYQLSSFLSFHKKKLFCKFPKYGRVDHFDYFPECQRLPKQFTLITEALGVFNLKKDFPSFHIGPRQPLNADFVTIEMTQK